MIFPNFRVILVALLLGWFLAAPAVAELPAGFVHESILSWRDQGQVSGSGPLTLMSAEGERFVAEGSGAGAQMGIIGREGPFLGVAAGFTVERMQGEGSELGLMIDFNQPGQAYTVRGRLFLTMVDGMMRVLYAIDGYDGSAYWEYMSGSLGDTALPGWNPNEEIELGMYRSGPRDFTISIHSSTGGAEVTLIPMEWDTKALVAIVPGPVIKNGMAYLYASKPAGEGNSFRGHAVSTRVLEGRVAPCTFTLSPTSRSFTSAGGSVSVSVSASRSDCGWSVSESLSWVQVSPASGTGNGSVTVTVDANSGSSRSGTVTIGGAGFQVTQDASGCSFTLSPTSRSFTSAGGSVSVSVSASRSDCGWSVSESLSWVQVSPASGTGNGSVTVAVDANSGPSRSGTVTIGGAGFQVTQDASGCSFTLSPTSRSFTSAGGSVSVSVSASRSDCGWSVSESLSWVQVSPASGTGNGSVTVTVDANSGPSRSGTVTIGGAGFQVTQEAASTLPDFVNSLGMVFKYISPRTFLMGSPGSEEGRVWDEVQHQVSLTRGFYLQTTEVTQGQWKAVMGSNPSHYSSCGDDCPVESVSWNDVLAFIQALNNKEGTTKYRLPTEAEWECGCRAGRRPGFPSERTRGD